MNEDTEKQSEPKGQPECMCNGAGPSLTRMIAGLLPMLLPSEEASSHFKQAHVEFLKGVRAVLDQRIQAMASERAGTRINVE